MEPLQSDVEQHQQIEVAAYYLWQERGCPFGTPEVDWFQAEERASDHSGSDTGNPGIVAVAAAVGSALGSVTGFVESVGALLKSGSSHSE